MTINEYFDEVFCINLLRRKDRWAHVLDQCKRHAIKVRRFDGADMINWGNNGCTLSHRLVMEEIIRLGVPRSLILEDDFECRFDDTQERFAAMIQEVPDDWDFIYLGGHYSDEPKSRVSPHVIRFNRMKTTSSVGITLEQTRRMVHDITGSGPIDEIYSGWTEKHNAYIFQPRLMVQYNNYSDLQQRDMNNTPCMEDTRHENMV